MGEYRPSPVVRWPLHLLNVLLFITILALVGVSVVLVRLEEEPPWVLVGVGSVTRRRPVTAMLTAPSRSPLGSRRDVQLSHPVTITGANPRLRTVATLAPT